jgi:hypothetical protein
MTTPPKERVYPALPERHNDSIYPWDEDDLHAYADPLMDELDICRSAIEACYDMMQSLDCYTDMDAACQRATLRQLNEAVGKAAPRLLKERPGGQKLYGLHYQELRATIERQKEVILSCRGSVKADLIAYEQMQTRKPMNRLSGGIAYNEIVEIEIKRLTALLDSIDAITALQAELKEKS